MNKKEIKKELERLNYLLEHGIPEVRRMEKAIKEFEQFKW